MPIILFLFWVVFTIVAVNCEKSSDNKKRRDFYERDDITIKDDAWFKRHGVDKNEYYEAKFRLWHGYSVFCKTSEILEEMRTRKYDTMGYRYYRKIGEFSENNQQKR